MVMGETLVFSVTAASTTDQAARTVAITLRVKAHGAAANAAGSLTRSVRPTVRSPFNSKLARIMFRLAVAQSSLHRVIRYVSAQIGQLVFISHQMIETVLLPESTMPL